MNYLDIVVNDVAVRDTELGQFKTIAALENWVVACNYACSDLVVADYDVYVDAMNNLDRYVECRTAQLMNEIAERIRSSPPRNLDLIVIPFGDEPIVPALQDVKAGDVVNNLLLFTDAAQMVDYEFAAYELLGDEECDRQGIDTIYDMFGTEWATAFDKRREYLIIRFDLDRLYGARKELDTEIAALEKRAFELRD